MKFIIVIIFCNIITHIVAKNCLPRNYGSDSIVCVCNAVYCDAIDVYVPPKGRYKIHSSSQSGLRFYEQTLIFDNETNYPTKLYINTTEKYQSIIGFGGAFTDSAGFNIKQLSEKTQEQLLRAYFSKNGSNYNLGRVPIGGTDFSLRAYTLDDYPGDVTLKNFSLAREDIDYRIPYMKKALEINPELKFMAASWTAPPWMKTNNNYSGFLGLLREQYYQTYADYIVKFLESYKNHQLPIWAVSTGNEPTNVFDPFSEINDMGWTPDSVTDWVIKNFGPALANSTSNETIILGLDDQRFSLPWFIEEMYRRNSRIDKYIAGIGIHWYADQLFSIDAYDRTHALFPDKFILMTEACVGSLPWEPHGIILGSWRRAEKYILNIIEDLNHWVTGWVDWNLALNRKGGPTYINNFVDSQIIVHPQLDEFFKQPMYYAMAHFSKFLPRGSVRVDLTQVPDVKSVAFVTPEHTVVIILYNASDDPVDVAIEDPERGIIKTNLQRRTIQTIIYQQ
ncbi:lysosomal acid glucosylceramidase-like [Chelonus insularis]|uniref:lysosomal acid glucosylceramidase-like n=1 Tax=Chelonus insularis TaxID=460826 RepID=UPI00158ABD41|nr:lysosomal acid glucosylceramidase-like [Chelonus insularis]